MKHIMNFNEIVSVQLTDHGWNVWNKSDWGGLARLEQHRRRLDTQLWVLMNVFGPHMGNGSPQIFIDNILEVKCG